MTKTVRITRRGVLISAALHLSVLGLLCADFVWPFLLPSPLTRSAAKQVVLEARVGLRSADVAEVVAELRPVGPQRENILANSEAGQPPEQVLGQRATASIERAAAEAKQRTAEENQQQLAELAGKLGRISNEESVDEMAGKLRQWLGMRERAERPAAGSVEGEFDFLTAQLHDVRREQAEGATTYFAVLVDAAGRRYESRMDEVEGESAYKTMQLVKANPLAEMVYRRIVMGFLDNVIKAAAQAEEAAEASATSPEAASVPLKAAR